MPPARRAVAAPQRLQFIFTKNSFRIDHPEWALEEPEERLKNSSSRIGARLYFCWGFLMLLGLRALHWVSCALFPQSSCGR